MRPALEKILRTGDNVARTQYNNENNVFNGSIREASPANNLNPWGSVGSKCHPRG